MRVTVHTLRRMLQGLEVGLLCIKIQIFKNAKVHIYAWAGISAYSEKYDFL